MRTNSHTFRILNHLREHGSISSMESITEYGNTRLSATIHLLRHKYFIPIESVDTIGVNRYGRKTKFTTYYLREEE